MFSRRSSTSELLRDIVRKIGKIEKWQRDRTGDSPLFDIANEHTPDTLTTDQNDYDPGWYDVLRITATTAISITGITKGKKGRFLELYNTSGSGRITLPYESGFSAAVNRIINSTGQNIYVYPSGRVRLYYDSTLDRWIVPDPPSYQGPEGISATLTLRGGVGTQSIPNDTPTKILFDTATPDYWGMFDAANNRILAPTGLGGLYAGRFAIQWASHATAGNLRSLQIYMGGGLESGLDVPSIANRTQWVSCPIGIVLASGQTLEFYVHQVSGGNLTVTYARVDIGKTT